MRFNYSKLKGKILEVYKTQGAFAEALGVSITTLNLKLNNKSEWNTLEIVRSCELLGIPLAEAHLYFFSV